MHLPIHTLTAAAAATLVMAATTAHAASDPKGLWFEHEQRDAVEIRDCADGKGLCGYVVHVKDAAGADRCGVQMLGEITPDGGGWIFSHASKRRYDVALKRNGNGTLTVERNAGSRHFSRAFTWERAPAGIARCNGTAAETAPAPESKPATADKPAPAKPKAKRSKSAKTTVKQPTRTAAATDKPASAGTSGATGSERRCTYRIPYVGRTVSYRCRN